MKKKFFTRQDIGLAYISPWIIGFLAFTLIPMVVSFGYSFCSFASIRTFHFVGLKNYKEMFHQFDFILSLKATFMYVVFSVPVKLASALIVALLLQKKVKGINLFRTLYYLPSILGGSVAIGILWKMMFAKNGLINAIAGMFGIAARNWLGNPKTAIYIICILPIWQFGSSMVIFLAALKQIPSQLYEAALIDGANTHTRFWRITMPMISPVLLFNLVMQSIGAFQEFGSAYIITDGGPAKTTYLYSLMIYDQAFLNLRFGYASALSWFLFVVIIGFTIVLFGTSGKWTFYQDGRGII